MFNAWSAFIHSYFIGSVCLSGGVGKLSQSRKTSLQLDLHEHHCSGSSWRKASNKPRQVFIFNIHYHLFNFF